MAAKGQLRVRIVGDDSGLRKTLKNIGGPLGTFAKVAAGAVAVAGGAAIKAFADFDQAMTNSTAIMGDLTEAMRDDMSRAARDVAKTTKFSATEAAESYFFLASAGLDAEQSIAALPRVAAFAQAGNFDMALATDLATDAQSALGLASEDSAENLANLTRVTDVFVKANTLANTSVEQISEAMTNKAGAAARSVGMDIEEAAAVIAAFADQGVKGADAGTQFAIVLRDLQTKALANKDAFKKAGVQVFDSSGEFRNMADIIGDLETRLDGMSDAQRKAELSALGFSDKSMGALMTLLGTSDAIREYEGALDSASGVTDEVANKQLDTFWAQLGLLKDQLIDVGLTIGEALMPHIRNFVDFMQDNVVPGIERLVGAFEEGGLSGALSEFGDMFAESWPTIRENLGILASNVWSWVTETFIPGLVDALGKAAVAFGEWVSDAARELFDNLPQIMATTRTWFNDTFVPNVGGWVSDAGDKFGEFGEVASSALDGSLLEVDTVSSRWFVRYSANTLHKVGVSAKLFEHFGPIAAAQMGRNLPKVTAAFGRWAVRDLLPTLGRWGLTAMGVLLNPMRLASGLQNAVHSFLGRAAGFFRPMFRWMRDTGTKIAFSFVAGFLSTVTKSFWRRMASFVSIGKNIGRSIVRGISSLGSWVQDQVGAWISRNITGPIKRALGIRSPSKVGQDIGNNLAGSIAMGITDNAWMADRAMGDLLDIADKSARTQLDVAVGREFGGRTPSPLAAQVGSGGDQLVEIRNVIELDGKVLYESVKRQAVRDGRRNVTAGLT